MSRMKIKIVSCPAKFTPSKLQISVDTKEDLQILLSICDMAVEVWGTDSSECDFLHTLRQVLLRI